MSGEGFLARWSRRKRAATAAPAAAPMAPAGAPPMAPAGPMPPAAPASMLPAGPAPGPPAEPAPVLVQRPEASSAEAGSPAPAFDPASLPPVESLTAESDITAFLRPDVPAALRGAALRRAWTLDPAIRDYVGPTDYAWDFNAPDGMAGFSLELGGDVKRLLAQAIGIEEAPDPGSPDPEAPDLGAPDLGAADPGDPGAAEVMAGPGAAPPGLPPLDPLRLEPPPPEEPLPEAGSAPAPAALPDRAPPAGPAQAGEPPPPARRHGGARPA